MALAQGQQHSRIGRHPVQGLFQDRDRFGKALVAHIEPGQLDLSKGGGVALGSLLQPLASLWLVVELGVGPAQARLGQVIPGLNLQHLVQHLASQVEAPLFLAHLAQGGIVLRVVRIGQDGLPQGSHRLSRLLQPQVGHGHDQIGGCIAGILAHRTPSLDQRALVMALVQIVEGQPVMFGADPALGVLDDEHPQQRQCPYQQCRLFIHGGRCGRAGAGRWPCSWSAGPSRRS